MARLTESETPTGEWRLAIDGRLDGTSIRQLWPMGLAALQRHARQAVRIDASAIEHCDTAGAAMLIDLLRQPRSPGAAVRLEAVPDAVRQLLGRFDVAALSAPAQPTPERAPLTERVGRAGARLAADAHAMVEFVGAATAALVAALRHPSQVRWGDVLRAAHEAGVSALPIVALIAFLLGVILAFQSATALQRFGAEVFVADLVGLSLLRELGPLITAILLAGRSGAAFAAEIGTMKVNQEIDALTTMGLDPLRFLVATRVLAAVLVVPVLSLFANVVGLVGGALVMLTFDIPFGTYYREVVQIVDLSDLFTGLGKSVVFGLLVAGIGCLRGLQTRSGAAAVGRSTTSAVVSGIVLIVVADGVFAMVFFYLGV